VYVLVETPAGKSIEQLYFRISPFCHPAGELDLPNGPSQPTSLHIEFAASVGSRAASISFEQSDQEQENHNAGYAASALAAGCCSAERGSSWEL
jgi:hypothetical protein